MPRQTIDPPRHGKKMKCKGKFEKEDETDTSERKAVAKFKLQSSLVFDGKGRNNLNVSTPIYITIKIAITTQDGSKAS